MTLTISGKNAYGLLKSEKAYIALVRISPLMRIKEDTLPLLHQVFLNLKVTMI